jgi:hypothetical protein
MLKRPFMIAIACLTACGEKNSTSPPTGDEKFNAYKERTIESLWHLYPEWASGVGYHRYDSVLTVPDESRHVMELAFYRAHADSLAAIKPGDLSAHNRTDYFMLRDHFSGGIWRMTTLRRYEWDPSVYNVSETFAEMLNNKYDSLDVRLLNVRLRLANVPAYYEAAKKRIKVPTKEHTALAIDQNAGGLVVFGEELQNALSSSGLSPGLRSDITARAASAVAAISSFTAWLKALPNPAPRPFVLGRTLYDEKFAHDIQSSLDAGQVYARANARKEYLHGRMTDLTRQLWPKYFGNAAMPSSPLKAIRKMIDTLSLRHVAADSFQQAIEAHIPQLVKFVNERKLLTLDPTRPLVVRREPAYMAGIAGASINSPGPYNRKGNTYYNVGSLSGWEKSRAESYLREYNHWILQILNIHEAIPGHYTQLVYSNNAPSMVKSIFGNGAMVEGWAVYTELMMLENGYGADGDNKTAPPEMWLMYYKWNLRTVCNTILDHGVHVNGMGHDEAIRLLTGEAFQQEAEAEGKWRRVTLTQVQLCSYFTGFTEIIDLREEIKVRLGDKFSLKEFHEKFLSYGSAPVKYIREMMLAEIKGRS